MFLPWSCTNITGMASAPCVCNGIKMKSSSRLLQLCLTTNCLLEIRSGAFISIGNAAALTFDPTPRKKTIVMAFFNVFNYKTAHTDYHHARRRMTGDEIRQAHGRMMRLPQDFFYTEIFTSTTRIKLIITTKILNYDQTLWLICWNL